MTLSASDVLALHILYQDRLPPGATPVEAMAVARQVADGVKENRMLDEFLNTLGTVE